MKDFYTYLYTFNSRKTLYVSFHVHHKSVAYIVNIEKECIYELILLPNMIYKAVTITIFKYINMRYEAFFCSDPPPPPSFQDMSIL